MTALTAAGTETPEARVARLNAELAGAGALEIIEAAVREFGGGLTYVSSFGAESAAMLGLISEAAPDMPIQFIDTGMHFHQTLEYRDMLIERLGLTGVRTIKPNREEVKAIDPKGQLNKTEPDLCCEVRKVRPLGPALEGFNAWITGRKRFHGTTRANLAIFEYSEGRYKVNPLANWNQEDIDLFFSSRDLPKHPLVAEGYASIGCWPCTIRPTDPNDVRSGRWAGKAKTECGLHVETKDRPRVF
jgi:phosphoadenosine phosphosulfate reductase